MQDDPRLLQCGFALLVLLETALRVPAGLPAWPSWPAGGLSLLVVVTLATVLVPRPGTPGPYVWVAGADLAVVGLTRLTPEGSAAAILSVLPVLWLARHLGRRGAWAGRGRTAARLRAGHRVRRRRRRGPGPGGAAAGGGGDRGPGDRLGGASCAARTGRGHQARARPGRRARHDRAPAAHGRGDPRHRRRGAAAARRAGSLRGPQQAARGLHGAGLPRRPRRHRRTAGTGAPRRRGHRDGSRRDADPPGPARRGVRRHPDLGRAGSRAACAVGLGALDP